MTPQCFLQHIVDPGLAFLAEVAGVPVDDKARIMLVAIGMQETHLLARSQFAGGPARGWFQFEIVGVRGVLMNRASSDKIRKMLDVLVIPNDPNAVWQAITYSDHMAVMLARMNLYRDPHPLPSDENGAWEVYLRVWIPGRPRREDWTANYAAAVAAVAAVSGAP